MMHPVKRARRWISLAAIALLTVACSNGDGLELEIPQAEQPQWLTYAGGPKRTFFNADETQITRDNVHELEILWTFPTGAMRAL